MLAALSPLGALALGFALGTVIAWALRSWLARLDEAHAVVRERSFCYRLVRGARAIELLDVAVRIRARGPLDPELVEPAAPADWRARGVPS